ncbi:MAG: tetratricopeptide repeat protein [Curvibacter sp.]|jgi:cytochrome c-type biogenesis protein CcmH/NrfG|nr:tetratricopeptide repeat protein [Curvibacter sp.]
MKTLALLAVLAALLLSPQAHAAYDTPDTPTQSDLSPAIKLIENKNWSDAISSLLVYTRANPNSADGFNLLGYSYRQLKRYDESFAAYNKALALDPKHRGAHEYIGEAYIQLGQLDKAKVHLEALSRICTLSCHEYRDLKKAYEAALAVRRP